VKLAEMTLEINVYELTTPFECCIFETTNGSWGILFKILVQKMCEMGKKILVSSILLLLRWEILLLRAVLKVQRVMLI
jgi:hypothetical protein